MNNKSIEALASYAADPSGDPDHAEAMRWAIEQIEQVRKHKPLLTRLMRWIADVSDGMEDESGANRARFVAQCYDMHRSGLIDMAEIFPSDLAAFEAAR